MSEIDVAAIDAQIAEHEEQIQMLQSLRKLATDPKMRELITKFSRNGKNGAGSSKSAITEVTRDATPDGDSSQSTRGELQAAVAAALPHVPNEFTSVDVVRVMEKNGYKFKASSPTIAVNEVLTTIERKTGEVKFTGEKRGVFKLWRKISVVAQVNSRTA